MAHLSGHPQTSRSQAANPWLHGLTLLLMVLVAGPSVAQPRPQVRVAVVGGLQASGVWPRLAHAAGDALELDVRTVAASPKEGVVPAFRGGHADLLLIHASDEAAALEAAGYAAPLRTWAFNEHVIVGPDADPLRIRETSSGIEALRRIAAAKAPFLALRDPGSYGIVQRLWRLGSVRPDPEWVQWDGGNSRHDIMGLVAQRGAYAVIGHIPVATGKLAAPGVSVLLAGDPLMRRPYVALAPGPRHDSSAQARRDAQRVIDYLLSPAGQAALQTAAKDSGGTWLFPAASADALLDAEAAAPAPTPPPPGSRAKP